MNFIHLAYRLFGSAFAMALLPSIWLHHNIRGRDLDRFYQRLGFYPATLRSHLQGAPRIWLHAVSVGEVGVAAAVAQALKTNRPDCTIALSSTTKQGLARARDVMGRTAACFYAPLDLVGPAQKALKLIRPHFLGLLETEIWPNLII